MSAPLAVRLASARRSARAPVRVAQVVTRLTAGAGGMALEGALSLDPERYATTFFTSEGSSLVPAAEEAGFRVVPLRRMTTGRGVYPWADYRALRELEERLAEDRFDLVHTHSSKAGALGRIAARRLGVAAVVHTFHGFPFHEFQAAPVRAALVAAERRLGRLTDFFLATGTATAAEAVRLGIAPPDRIRAIATVPTGAEVRRVTPASRRAARALLALPEEAKAVGTVARLDAQKSPRDLVEAIAALGRDDVHAVWVGGGSLRAETERLIVRRGLAGRFLLLGERSDVAALLPAFDVFALSSLFEGLPCALVEAMLCGIPVVATAVCSVPELVIAGSTGLLARPRDPRSLARALAWVLDHPGQARRLAESARAHVTTRCRRDVLGADLVEVYEAALEGRRARSPVPVGGAER